MPPIADIAFPRARCNIYRRSEVAVPKYTDRKRGLAVRTLCGITVLLTLGFAAASPAAETIPRSVLLLDQGFVGSPWYDAYAGAFRSAFATSSTARVSVHVEHLDFGHFSGPQYEDQLRAYLRGKYRVHPEFAESLRAARTSGIVGAEVFTGKDVRGRVVPMNKKAWAAKFKKYAVLAGVNEPKKSCHGVRKARAEVAAYADCTESQMMAMFGWTDPKMPAHYIAQANRERLGISGMDKIVAFDQSQSLDDFMPLPEANNGGTPRGNGVVTFPGNIRKKLKDFNAKRGFVVRSEGLEPPRFYSLPPQGSASTNSATSAWDTGWERWPAGSTAPM